MKQNNLKVRVKYSRVIFTRNCTVTHSTRNTEKIHYSRQTLCVSMTTLSLYLDRYIDKYVILLQLFATSVFSLFLDICLIIYKEGAL